MWLFISTLGFTNATRQRRVLADVNEGIRLEHARELLGAKLYGKSPIYITAGYRQVNEFIFEEAKNALPDKYQKQAFNVAQAIISEANKFQLDPTFVLAVIKQESHFNPDVVGGVGELGLMQVRPETGEWIAKKYNMKWHGPSTIKDPVGNIRVGVQYMAYLREMFGHGRLYLSAYNMGPTRVRTNLMKNLWPKEYSSGVMKKYLDLNRALATKISLENVSLSKMIALQE